MKAVKLFMVLFVVSNFSCASQDIMGKLKKAGKELTRSNTTISNEEVVSGLKEALSIGAMNSAELTSKLDGFNKNPKIYIPFPEEAIKVKNTLMDVGFENQVNRFELTMNRAAEEATKEAANIFVNAITSMSVQDGISILKGGQGAATEFLKNSTKAQLVEAFSPKVQTAIETVELAKYWEPLILKYNQVNSLNPFGASEDIDTDINAYVTDKAIDGLFVMVAIEENNIRNDPAARVTDLLKKVFTYQ